jgi:hypothetical protein
MYLMVIAIVAWPGNANPLRRRTAHGQVRAGGVTQHVLRESAEGLLACTRSGMSQPPRRS